MKAAKASLARALDRPDPAIRFYLFHGPNESQSRAFGQRLLQALDAEKVALSAATAKADPAILADEAGAIGLFGGRRAIWVEPATDDISEAVGALLGAPAVESPVIAIAGVLRKTSALVKIAEAHGLALAHASYQPDQRDAERMVEEIARSEGLRLAPGVAARIAGAAGNDRGVVAQELAKIATYADAAPDSPADVDHELVDAIGTASEGDSARLVDLALSGDLDALADELERIAGGTEPIPVVRALQRRLMMLAPIRAQVDRGQRPHDAVTSSGKSVFFKEKALVTKLVGTWDSKSLERVMERSGELERRLMRSDSPPPAEALGEELVAIARMARRK